MVTKKKRYQDDVYRIAINYYSLIGMALVVSIAVSKWSTIDKQVVELNFLVLYL